MKRIGAVLLLVTLAGCATAEKPVHLTAQDGHFRVTLGGAEIEMTGKGIEYRSGILAEGESAAAWKDSPVQGYQGQAKPEKAPEKKPEAAPLPPVPEVPPAPVEE